MNTKCTRIIPAALAALLCLAAAPAAGELLFGTFDARDSLHIEPDASADAQAMLDDLAWQAEPFQVLCQADEGHGDESGPDALVTFPSPYPSGDAVNDRVVMEWYAARDKQGRPLDTSAMLVLHILDGRMYVARLIARTFAFSGTHAFVLHLPHYGRRRGPDFREREAPFLARVRQGVVDARRARDAIAALPHVRSERIGIQGTSLGGFVTSITAAIDAAFDPVFITLGGADIHGMLLHGRRDSEKVRRHLEEAGYVGEKLRALAWAVEPSRLAHRLNPQCTWLYSAKDDQVVPAANARTLATAAGLAPAHHVWLSGDHYTCAIHLPRVTAHMARVIREQNKRHTRVVPSVVPAPPGRDDP